MADLYRRIVAVDDEGRPGTRHFISNIHVRVEPDMIVARSYFSVAQQTALLPLQLIACGAYRDTYCKHNGTWCFESRHIVCDQVGDLSRHMR